jgi:hypothetical protein
VAAARGPGRAARIVHHGALGYKLPDLIAYRMLDPPE